MSGAAGRPQARILGAALMLAALGAGAGDRTRQARARGQGIHHDHPPGDLMCGPLSLSLALEFMDVQVDPKGIADRVAMTEEGTSMRELARVAGEFAGVVATPYRLRSLRSLERLTRGTPAIVLLRGNHFSLAWGAGEGELWLAENPYPPRKVTPEELAAEADLRVLLIRPAGFSDPLAGPSAWRIALGGGGAILLAVSLVLLARKMKRVGGGPEASAASADG